MIFNNVKSLTIPEGEVVSVALNGQVLWNKPNELPYKTELEYLESTGTQYIDTGFIPDENDKMWLEFYPTKLQSSCFAGCRNSSSGDRFTINSGNSNRTQYGGMGDTRNVTLGNHTVARHTVSIENGLFTYDSKEVVVSSDEIGVLTSRYTIYLFACNTNGATLESDCRIYSCEIWDNGTLVYDFIPVLDLNNVPCMYDKVSGELFYNKGTGEFLYGERV